MNSGEGARVVRNLVPSDWHQVRAIYSEGIQTRNATFETEAPDWETWDSGHLLNCRLVVAQDDRVLGWAALVPVSDRCVYGGVAEVSVYVAESGRGKGVGSSLLERLVESSEEAGLWTLQAGIFPENEASFALHERFGFRRVGTREKLGQMDGGWRDVVLLERRSRRVGV